MKLLDCEKKLLSQCYKDIWVARKQLKLTLAWRTEWGPKHKIQVGYLGKKAKIKTEITKI